MISESRPSIRNDSRQAPISHDAGNLPLLPPMQVRVRTNVKKVINIDLQAQTFTAFVKFEASWIDPELQEVADRIKVHVSELTVDWKNTNQSLGKLIITDDAERKELFTPRLRLQNLISKDADSEMKWFEFYASDGPPIICFRWEIKGVFQEAMELQMFPFDSQYLSMELVAGWDKTDKKYGVVLVKNQNKRYKSLCQKTGFVQNSEYHLHDRIDFVSKFTNPSESSSDKEYALLCCSMLVERR